MTETANLETIILSGVVHNEEFMRKVMPHIQEKYFVDPAHKTIWNVLSTYSDEYNAIPSREVLHIELKSMENINESVYQDSSELINKLYGDKAREAVEKSSKEWLSSATEKYCLERSVSLAVVDAIHIIDGDDKKGTMSSLPEMLQKALSVCFDTDIGHDYFEDYEERFEYYHAIENKIPFPLKALTVATKGGTSPKTLNMMVMPTGVGKTHWMTYLASQYLREGHDVLYITLEMAEERISERIDACLLDVTMDDLKKLPKSAFESKIKKAKEATKGKLITKEFPTSTVNASHIRFLLDDLKAKKGFVPKIVFVDYVNLMLSTRLKSIDSTYMTVKSIAEELRGLFVEREIMGWSASQTNRNGQGASDFDLNEVSESHGLSMTADFVIAGILTDEMEAMHQMRMKILKSRYGPKISFMVGMDREKMTFHDLDSVAPSLIEKHSSTQNLLDNMQAEKTKSFKF
jgi:replicative DNA helicase